MSILPGNITHRDSSTPLASDPGHVPRLQFELQLQFQLKSYFGIHFGAQNHRQVPSEPGHFTCEVLAQGPKVRGWRWRVSATRPWAVQWLERVHWHASAGESAVTPVNDMAGGLGVRSRFFFGDLMLWAPNFSKLSTLSADHINPFSMAGHNCCRGDEWWSSLLSKRSASSVCRWIYWAPGSAAGPTGWRVGRRGDVETWAGEAPYRRGQGRSASMAPVAGFV